MLRVLPTKGLEFQSGILFASDEVVREELLGKGIEVSLAGIHEIRIVAARTEPAGEASRRPLGASCSGRDPGQFASTLRYRTVLSMTSSFCIRKV